MKLAYVDTSCLVSIAFGESGYKTIAGQLESFDRLVSSNLLEAELRAALSRERAPEELENWLPAVRWIFPDRALTREYRHLLSEGYLRGADLFHVATALYFKKGVQSLEFVTTDKRQQAVARAVGL